MKMNTQASLLWFHALEPTTCSGGGEGGRLHCQAAFTLRGQADKSPIAAMQPQLSQHQNGRWDANAHIVSVSSSLTASHRRLSDRSRFQALPVQPISDNAVTKENVFFTSPVTSSRQRNLYRCIFVQRSPILS